MISKKIQVFFSNLIDIYLCNLIFLFSYTLSLYFVGIYIGDVEFNGS